MDLAHAAAAEAFTELVAAGHEDGPAHGGVNCHGYWSYPLEPGG